MFRSIVKRIQFYRTLALINKPFIEAVPFKEIQIKHMKRSTYKQYLAQLILEHPNWRQERLSNRYIFLMLIIFIGLFLRTLTVLLIRDDNNIMITFLGSQYHHFNMKRFYPEMVTFHFSIKEAFLYLYLFRSLKNYVSFQLIMAYCHQIYHPYLSEEENLQREKRAKYSHQLGLNLNAMKYMKKMIKLLFLFQFHCLASFPVMVAVSGWRTFLTLNPIKVNFNHFNNSPLLFTFYQISLPILVAFVSYVGLMLYSNILNYYCIVVLILRQKALKNQRYLEKW